MKYVYMVDYIWEEHLEDALSVDQCECYTQEEVLEQLDFLKDKEVNIINVKLVEDENRDHEEEISYTFGQEIIQLLGYKPIYMITRNKGERL